MLNLYLVRSFLKQLHNRYIIPKMDLEKSLSIHSASIGEIHDVPMTDIIRPFKSILDEQKVVSLMETLQVKDNHKIPLSGAILFALLNFQLLIMWL